MVYIKDFVSQIVRGKSIYRILFNWQVAEHCAGISGNILDVASGSSPSYYRYIKNPADVIKTDIEGIVGIDVVSDLNKPLPFKDGEFDTFLFFNALYTVKDRSKTLREIRRILKVRGTLHLSSPFICYEMKEPSDYVRLTSEGISQVLLDGGFNDITIFPFGERCTASTNLLYPFLFFRPLQGIAAALALLGDKLIPTKIKLLHPAPLGYFCTAKR